MVRESQGNPCCQDILMIKRRIHFFYCRVEIYVLAFQIKKCISSTIGKFLFI